MSLPVRQWDALIRPHAVAVVGASSRPGPQNFAQRILNNNAKVGYGGSIYLINPNHKTVLGRESFPAIGALPSVPDVCLISMPAPRAIEAVRESLDAGVRAFMVHSGDFADSGGEGIARQRELVDLCKAAGAALLGPNCLGMYHSQGPIALYGADIPDSLPQGRIAVVSASGAVSLELLKMGLTFGLHSAFSTGNEAVTTSEDILAHLVRDPTVGIVVVFVEALRKADEFRRIALEAREADKPLIVLKSGTSAAGAKVAEGHTGSLIGSAEAYDALFRQVGVVQVADFDELHGALRMFTTLRGRRLRGGGPGLVGISGGKLAVAVDVADRLSVAIPELGETTRNQIAEEMALPANIAVSNPVDVGAGFRSGTSVDKLVARCVELVAADPAVGAIVFPHGAGNGLGATSLDKIVADSLIEIAEGLPVPLLLASRSNFEETSFHTGSPETPNLALFGGLREVFAAVGAVYQWQNHKLSAEAEGASDRSADLAAMLKGLSGTLSSVQSEGLFEAYDIPVARSQILHGEDDIGSLDMPFPLVAKVVSADITHKIDVGGVVLGITNPSELRKAHAQIMANLARNAPDACIDGILVAQQIEGGSELFMGSRFEPGMGAIVAVGIGGTLVEIMPPPEVLLAPFSHEDAVSALMRMQGHELLSGFRGRPAADVARLARTAVSLARLMHDARDLVASIDLNPIIFNAQHPGGIAVDARVMLRGEPLQTH